MCTSSWHASVITISISLTANHAGCKVFHYFRVNGRLFLKCFHLSLFGKAEGLSIYNKNVVAKQLAQLHHLRSVDRLPGGRRSWGLDLGIDGLPFWGPSPWLVSLERVGSWLNTPQTGPVTDVHLLWSHLLTAGPLEAWATHTGMWPAARATVLAEGLAVSWRESTDGDQVFSRSC